jgi:hypothetical protein
MNSIIQKLSTGVLALMLPVISMAQNNSPSPEQDLGFFGDLTRQLSNLIDLLFPVVTGAAVLGFFIGLAKYVFQAGNDEAQEQGKSIMIAGVLALFFIVAIAGIVQALASSLGLEGGTIDGENPVTGGSNI